MVIGLVSMFFIILLVRFWVYLIYFMVMVCGWFRLLQIIVGFMQCELQFCIQLKWVKMQLFSCLVKYLIMLLCLVLLCISMFSFSCFWICIVWWILLCIVSMYLVLFSLFCLNDWWVRWIDEVCGKELMVVVGNVGRLSLVCCLVMCLVNGEWCWVLLVLIVVRCVCMVGLWICGEEVWLVWIVWFFFRVVSILVVFGLVVVWVSIVILWYFCMVKVSQFFSLVFSLFLCFRFIGLCSSEQDGVIYSCLFRCFWVWCIIFRVFFRLQCQMLCLLIRFSEMILQVGRWLRMFGYCFGVCIRLMCRLFIGRLVVRFRLFFRLLKQVVISFFSGLFCSRLQVCLKVFFYVCGRLRIRIGLLICIYFMFWLVRWCKIWLQSGSRWFSRLSLLNLVFLFLFSYRQVSGLISIGFIWWLRVLVLLIFLNSCFQFSWNC